MRQEAGGECLLPPRPWGLRWRCSVWFITSVVALGVTTDLLVYSLIVPIIPFQLEHLGYSGVSGLVGWLLFSYSGGIVAFTPPTAYLSERYNSRQFPLLCGQIALIGAQIMLMEAPKYWLMVIARLLQGLSSSVIWVAGLALLCDTVPEKSVGRQLGIAMSGMSIGYLVGPPVAGALYNSFGFRAPFIFGIIVTMVDLVGRLLIIERKHALIWSVDPAASAEADTESGDLKKVNVQCKEDVVPESRDPVERPAAVIIRTELRDIHQAEVEPQKSEAVIIARSTSERPHRISFLAVIAKLVTSSRAISACISTLAYGMVLTSQEPALPLHLQVIWHFDASKVGLVYIAAVVPTLFSSAIAGYLVDKKGAGAITVVFLAFSIPWVALLVLQKSLVLFIVVFALSNFAIAGVVSPLTAELAAVTRHLDGVGYAHVYGAFNLAYGVGSALGPIIGGQIYDHITRGWMVICFFGLGLVIVAIALAFFFFGDDPLYSQLLKWFHRRKQPH